MCIYMYIYTHKHTHMYIERGGVRLAYYEERENERSVCPSPSL